MTRPRDRDRLQGSRRNHATPLNSRDGLFRSTAAAGERRLRGRLARPAAKASSSRSRSSVRSRSTCPSKRVSRRRRRPSSCRAALATAARVADARNAQAICFEATAKLIDKQKNAEALARARGVTRPPTSRARASPTNSPSSRSRSASRRMGPSSWRAIERNLVALTEFNRKLERAHQEAGGSRPPREGPHRRRPAGAGRSAGARITLLLGRGRRGRGDQRLRPTRHARSRECRGEGPRGATNSRPTGSRRALPTPRPATTCSRRGPASPPSRTSRTACRRSARPWKSA